MFACSTAEGFFMSEIVSKQDKDSEPTSLFHYTTLDSLALILSNRTLRLNPLTKLDDPQEASTYDKSGWGRYIFVSCWTEQRTESIPMWKMYAGLESGVRIESETDPFARYQYTADQISSFTLFPKDNIEIEGGVATTFLPMEDMLRVTTPSLLQGAEVLRKVDYTSDQNRLNPTIVQSVSSQGEIRASLADLGRCKSKYWTFQKEWRYTLTFLPMNLFGDPETMEQRFANAFFKAHDLSSPALLDYYDLHLREDAIARMKFVFSPKMTPGNRVLAETLLSSFGLLGNIERSDLEGRL